MFEAPLDRRNLMKTGLAVPAGVLLARGIPVLAVAAQDDHGQAGEGSAELPFRQVHLDFHTSEQIVGIAAAFDPDEFAWTLKKASVNSVTCFARCHHGYIYYDTKLFPERHHPHLKRNLLKEQIEACHRHGIRVPIYTTIHWDHFTAHAHPEWLMRDEQGQAVGEQPGQAGFYRRLCMNTPYVDFLKQHLSELFDTVPVDGLFLDIVHEIECVCDFCKRGMAAEGLDPAKEKDRQAHARQVNVNFKREITRHIRSLDSDCTIFYNAGHIGPYIRASAETYTHFEMESLPGGSWGYTHFPLTARYVRTLGKEYLGMTGRFHTSWGDFHSYKNQAALEFECFSMLALGAKCSVGDQLHPKGIMDRATYDLIGSVYAQVEPKEPWCTGAQPVTEVAMMSAEEFIGGRMPPPSVGAIRMLQEGNHQFDVVDSKSGFEPYKVLILPDKIPVAGALKDKLKAFLGGGGAILASFESGLDADGRDFSLAEFGVKNAGSDLRDNSGNLVRGRVYYRNDYAEYVLPTDPIGKDLPATEHVMHIKGMTVEVTDGAEVLVHKVKSYFDRTPEHFCSHRQTPSSGEIDGPAVVRRGRVIYFTHPIFTQYYEDAPRWCRQMALNALNVLLPEPLVRLDAPSTTIATLNAQPQEKRWVLHLLHYIPERRGQAFDVVEDVIGVRDVKISVRTPPRVRTVACVPGRRKLKFARKGDRVEFTLPELHGHQMIALTF